jgi:hypothetical protein
MRLSDWRANAPSRDALGPKVTAVIEPVLASLVNDRDPHCWIAWGDDPGVRYTILTPSPAGLVTSFVRVNVPGEGPRASSKLVRWNRLQVGELAIETHGGHRLVSFQVEAAILRGADDEADRVTGFAHLLFAAMDGRTIEDPSPAPARANGARRSSRA